MITVSQGGATVSISGEMEAMLKRLVGRCETSTVRECRRIGEEVASEARASWYGSDGVTKRTGKSGQIRAVESIDLARGEVRVSVGSIDTRTAGKTAKPVPVYVHRPGRVSLIEVPVDRTRWMATTKSLRVPIAFAASGDPLYRIKVANPKASDGKFLLTETVKKPVRARIKAVAEAIARDTAHGK